MKKILILIAILSILACGREYPDVGEIWYFDQDNPFTTKVFVKITAIKNGWVQYTFKDNDGNFTGDFSEEEVESFRFYYNKKEDTGE